MSTAFLFGLSSNLLHSRWLQVQDKFKGAGFCCKTEEDVLAVFFSVQKTNVLFSTCLSLTSLCDVCLHGRGRV